MPLTLEGLPLECLVEILGEISAADLCTVMAVSSCMQSAASEDCLWRGLCVAGQHGGILDFKESLGCFRHPDAKPLLASADELPPISRRSTSSSGREWRDVFRISTDSLRHTICIDTGRGYAKYGMADAQPAMIQICQPNAGQDDWRSGLESGSVETSGPEDEGLAIARAVTAICDRIKANQFDF